MPRAFAHVNLEIPFSHLMRMSRRQLSIQEVIAGDIKSLMGT